MGFFQRVIHFLRGDSPLVVRKVFQDSVEIPTALKYLYGVEVVSYTEIIRYVSGEVVEKLISMKEMGVPLTLYMVITKEKEKDGLFLHNIYYFSFSKELLKTFVSLVGQVHFRWLSGLEIANLLRRFLFVRENLRIDRFEGKMIRGIDFFQKKDEVEIADRFYRVAKEVPQGEDIKVFVGGNFLGGVRDWETIFRLPFTGVIYFTFDFGKAEFLVKDKMKKASKLRKVFLEMKTDIEERKRFFGSVDMVFFTRDKEADRYVASLFQDLGFIPLEKRFGRDMFVKCLPFMVRDLDFTFLVESDELAKYMLYSFEKNVYPERVILYGKNRFGSYVGFNPFEEGDNPHGVILAPSGAGKSFFIQNLISQILRIDVKKVFYGESVWAKDHKVRIRHFDKGFSAELFYKLLKERGYNIGILEPRIEKLGYNICEVEREDDLEFSLEVVNVCLSALKQEPLKGFERPFYTKALRELYRDMKKRSYVMTEIEFLYQNERLREVYEKLRRLGYEDGDYIGDIKEKEFDFLKQPVIADVIRILKGSQDFTMGREEREALESLIAKLEILSEYDMISVPSQIDFKAERLVYFDYEFLQEHTLFVPIVLGILKKMVYVDKFVGRTEAEDDVVFYFIDECHNFFRNPYFHTALNILIREARKYRLGVYFSTQNYDDIPPEVLTNVETRMFLTPQEFTKKQSYLRGLSKHVGVDLDKTDLAKLYYLLPQRVLACWYAKGVFSVFLDVDEIKLRVFDSYRKEIELPEGKVLKKSMVVEEERERRVRESKRKRR